MLLSYAVAGKIGHMAKLPHEILRDRRIALGLEPKDVAQLAGITRQGYVKIESGETKNPRGENLVPIARVLGLTLEEVFSGEVSNISDIAGNDPDTVEIRRFAPNTPIPDALKLLINFDHLDIAGRRAVDALIDGLLGQKKKVKQEEDASEE